MLTAVVTLAGDTLVTVRLRTASTEPPADEAHASNEGDTGAETDTAAEEHATEAQEEGPSPIAPELHELAWGAGAFVVLAVVMRYAIFPRLRSGMRARYEAIERGFTDADALRASARTEVSQYEAALAGVRAEAATRVDAARQALDAERQARLSEVNARIAERRAAAAAQAEAARQAAAGQVNEAVGTVAFRLVELVTGNPVPADVLRQAVDEVTAASATGGGAR